MRCDLESEEAFIPAELALGVGLPYHVGAWDEVDWLHDGPDNGLADALAHHVNPPAA